MTRNVKTVVPLLLMFALPSFAQSPQSPAPAEPTPQASATAPSTQGPVVPNVAGLVERVRDTVVSVEVTARAPTSTMQRPFGPDPFGEFFGPGVPEGGGPGGGFGGEEQYREGLGSGFIIDSSGLVLTNHHVVEGATAIQVQLADQRILEATVVGRDPLTDVALLRLKGDIQGLPTARLGDSDAMQVGEIVVAIGSPFGLTATVSAGILSATARVIGAGPYDDFLQTDAAINPGNSGGPLFNLRGEVIGMNTAIVGGGTGIGFAVPSNLVKALLPQLQKEGVVTRGWLGLQLQELTPPLAQALRVPRQSGAIVTDVLPNSPSASAGLQRDDVITGLNGRPLESAAALSRQVALMNPGQSVVLERYRNGNRGEVRVNLGKRPDFEGVATAPKPAQEDAQQRYGLTISNVPPQLAAQQNLPAGGALVTEVLPGSPAARAGLEQGMIVVEVGNTPVENAADLVAALKRAKPGDSILMRTRVLGSDAVVLRALVAP